MNLIQLTCFTTWNNAFTGTIPASIGGEIPPQIGNLTNLTALSFRSSQFTGNLPAEIGNLTNLQVLSLRENQLSGQIPKSFTNLVNLIPEFARFDHNMLTANHSVTRFINQTNPGWRNTQTIAPSALTASPIREGVTLTWTPIRYQTDGGYYQIEYSTAPDGVYTVAGQTADKTANTYTLTGLTSGIPHYFRVRTITPAHASNTNALTSPPSTVVSATPRMTLALIDPAPLPNNSALQWRVIARATDYRNRSAWQNFSTDFGTGLRRMN